MAPAGKAAPAASVVAVAPPGKVAPAPDPGPANVTVTPETGFPYWSATAAVSGDANDVFTAADCPPPEKAVIPAAAPADTVTAAVVPLTVVAAVSRAVIVHEPTVFR